MLSYASGPVYQQRHYGTYVYTAGMITPRKRSSYLPFACSVTSVSKGLIGMSNCSNMFKRNRQTAAADDSNSPAQLSHDVAKRVAQMKALRVGSHLLCDVSSKAYGAAACLRAVDDFEVCCSCHVTTQERLTPKS